MEIDDPTAQGQQTDAENPAGDVDGNQDSGEGQAQNGIQKRIDELTAKMYDVQRRAESTVAQKDEQITQLLAMLAQVEQQKTQTVDDAFQLPDDPEAQRVAAAIKPLMERMEQKMRALESSLGSFQHVAQVDTVAQKYGPEVAAQAKRVLAHWQQKGIPGNAEDAVTYTLGQMAQQGQLPAARSRDERGRFNQQDQGLTTGAPPPPAVNPNRAGTIPPNLESLPLDQQIEFWQKRLDGKTF